MAMIKTYFQTILANKIVRDKLSAVYQIQFTAHFYAGFEGLLK